ncbi:hypothetical protein RDOM_000140 [Rhyzopertha dominica]|nr:hypothetical protein RDOM_000140 [Rhyzopertha dominica]
MKAAVCFFVLAFCDSVLCAAMHPGNNGIETRKHKKCQKVRDSADSNNEILQQFLHLLDQLGSSSSSTSNFFQDQDLIQHILPNNQNPQLIGFIRFLELLNNQDSQSSNSLPQIPGLNQFIQIFTDPQSSVSLFGWQQLFSAIPGLQQFTANASRGGFGSFAHNIAGGIHLFTNALFRLASAGPFNPFGPMIGGFAGALSAAASQGENLAHLADIPLSIFNSINENHS